jgi:hypothetical protein
MKKMLEYFHEKSRWVLYSLLWGGKRAARRVATVAWDMERATMA